MIAGFQPSTVSLSNLEIAKPGILGRFFLGGGEVEFPYFFPPLPWEVKPPVKILATAIWDDDQKIPKSSKTVDFLGEKSLCFFNGLSWTNPAAPISRTHLLKKNTKISEKCLEQLLLVVLRIITLFPKAGTTTGFFTSSMCSIDDLFMMWTRWPPTPPVGSFAAVLGAWTQMLRATVGSLGAVLGVCLVAVREMLGTKVAALDSVLVAVREVLGATYLGFQTTV